VCWRSDRGAVEVLRKADVIVLDEIKAAGLLRQGLAIVRGLLPVKTVGVVGDERSYENVIALRVVESQDGMTLTGCRCPMSCSQISNRILNEVRGLTAWFTTSPPSASDH